MQLFLFTACYHNRISSIIHRFLKRTEHLVSPVLPAPKKPKVSSKQGAADLLPSGHSSLDYLFMKAEANSFAKVAIWLLTIIGSL